MKIQTRLSLGILAIFFCGWLISGLTIYMVEQRQARQDTVLSAEMLMSTAIAARRYTLEEVEPLWRYTDGENYMPQTVPSYAAQRIFALLRDQYPGYAYVEKALNPTNLKDLPEAWQVEIIQAFIENPELEKITGERITKAGGDILYVAQPIKIRKESCLQCHSTPDVAPQSLLNTYGSSNGFGWQLNEIIGSRLITVPVSISQKQSQEAFTSYLILIASIFLVAYITVSLIVKRWIMSPLDSISHLVEQISLHRVENSQLPEEKSDELGTLSKSINRLLISLQKALTNRKNNSQ